VRARTWMVLAAGMAVMPAAPAHAAPAHVVGRPVPASATHLVPGTVPGGYVTTGYAASGAILTVAYDRRGRLLWTAGRLPRCGNCDGEREPQLLPGGVYGPIGPTGDDVWAVDRRGRIVDGCAGVVPAPGECISSGNIAVAGEAGPATPAVTRRDARGPVWTHIETGLRFQPEADVWPPVVADGGGTVYTRFGDAPPGSEDGARLIAIDAATGTVRWRRAGRAEVLTALGRGVVVRDDDGLTALAADGAVTWTSRLAVSDAVLDAPRGRVLVTTSRSRPRVVALDTATGRTLLTVPGARGQRLVHVGRGGTAYVVRDRTPGSSELRAYDTSGRLLWRHRAATGIDDALESSDGTVLVALRGHPVGLVTRIDPRRAARPPATGRGDLFPRRVRRSCGGACALTPGRSALLTLDMPRATAVTLTVRRPGRRPGLPVHIPAPPGRSHLPFTISPRAVPGPATVVLRWRERGRPVVRRLAVTFAR
jgi:outer membrane protein assembly factor BamB